MSLAQEEQRHLQRSAGPAKSSTDSARDRPLSVNELTPSGVHTGSEVYSVDRSSSQASGGRNPEGLPGHTPGPNVEWPRGRPRNAISRIGYLDDACEASTIVPDGRETVELKSSSADHMAKLRIQSAASSPMGTPRDVKGSRAMSRQRVQQLHLAVPTSV